MNKNQKRSKKKLKDKKILLQKYENWKNINKKSP